MTSCGINIISRNGPHSETELIETLKNCDKGVIIDVPTNATKIVNNETIYISHIMIITGLCYQDGGYQAMVYDTTSPGDGGVCYSGPEPISGLNLANAVTWVIQ